MKILRDNISDSGFYNYYLIDDNKKLGIIYCDNGDLYFTSFDRNQETDFFITKENMIIYNLFDALYKSFKNGDVFQVSDYDLSQCSDNNEKRRLYTQIFEANKNLKNSELYKKVFNNEKIIWISDDSISFDYKNADSMTISNEGEYYKLKFTYYEDLYPHLRSIRIRNARSRYKPFNALMMDFFNNLQRYDPDYHQMHIEEYLYRQEKQKKLIK